MRRRDVRPDSGRRRGGAPVARRVALGLATLLLAACHGDGIEHPQAGTGMGGLQLLYKAAVPGARDVYPWISTDGTRLYADIHQQVQAFDLATGNLLWSHARPSPGPTSLVPRGGRLFFVGDTAFALDAATGRELWSYVPDSYSGFCGCDGDQDAFYFGSTQHRVYALRASDGALLWMRDVGPDWPYKGVVRGIVVSGDTVYAAVEHDTGVNGYIGIGEIFALDRHTGKILWDYSNGDGTRLDIFQSAPRVAGRLLLATADWDNQYIAVDRMTGKEVWRASGTYGWFGPDQAPVVQGNTVYVASEDQHAMAMDLATGRVLWRSPITSGAEYIAVCGSRLLVNDFGLEVIDPPSGRVIVRTFGWADDQDILQTSMVVVGDHVYMFSYSSLLAFKCPS
jgi:outer membrane protein assembly factor BamB